MFTVNLLIHFVTLLIICFQAWTVTIEKVRLIGDNNSYINVQSTKAAILRCPYRAGYDDPVITVNWYKDGHLVYSWDEGETVSRAGRDLITSVITSDIPNLQNIHFKKEIPLSLSGNYTCEIVSKKETVKSKPFRLVVLDIPSDDFQSNVTLMANVPEEEAPENEEKNCTLLWNFKTPAIFPRPNVTCGYYSYLHDDVTKSVPAGLTMNLLVNGSWQAEFEHTHIQVAEIPHKNRLGCAVSVPDTEYKKVIKFEDNFALDHLIDSEGCPSLFADETFSLKIHFDEGEMNCRGEIVPASAVPLKVQIWCNRNEIAEFSNGTALINWSMYLTCNPTDLTWRTFTEGGEMSPQIIDVQKDVPICRPYPSSGGQKLYITSGILMSLLISLPRYSLFT